MTTQTFPVIGGSRTRLTRLDNCGNIAYGASAQAVTDGFVSVAITANYDDGTEISVRNADGRRCVQRDAEPELVNLSATITFCKVDPDWYTALTGFPAEVNATGETIGFRVDSSILPNSVRNALEVWADAFDEGCGVDGEVPYAYFLWPNLGGGRVSDYTLENNAVTFAISGMLTKKGSGWGVGPYDVTRDETDAPDALQSPVTATQHQVTFYTTVAPPAVTDGLTTLTEPV
ncbi:major tail protein [Pseudanabaena phage Pam4]|nr:major tail protein [Pseudanabaena phage Pam4]